jgi:hypothetical protein
MRHSSTEDVIYEWDIYTSTVYTQHSTSACPVCKVTVAFTTRIKDLSQLYE